MTIKNLKILVCDNCKKKVSDNGDMHIGGHPFSGWFNVKRKTGGTALHCLSMHNEFDFCSKKCITEYDFKNN